MRYFIRGATLALIVAVGVEAGCVPLIGAQEPSTVPDGTGYHLELKWEHARPEMQGNAEITVHVVGPGEVKRRWLELGQEIPRGGIVMGFSQIWEYKYKIPSRPDFKCDIYLSFAPALDEATFNHEVRHCNGWTHEVWTEQNVGAE
jgi:hypothetical protein